MIFVVKFNFASPAPKKFNINNIQKTIPKSS